MIGGCFGALCLGRPDWGFNPVNGYDDLVKQMHGAGGGVSFCSSQNFSPLPDPCDPYVPRSADYQGIPPEIVCPNPF